VTRSSLRIFASPRLLETLPIPTWPVCATVRFRPLLGLSKILILWDLCKLKTQNHPWLRDLSSKLIEIQSNNNDDPTIIVIIFIIIVHCITSTIMSDLAPFVAVALREKVILDLMQEIATLQQKNAALQQKNAAEQHVTLAFHNEKAAFCESHPDTFSTFMPRIRAIKRRLKRQYHAARYRSLGRSQATDVPDEPFMTLFAEAKSLWNEIGALAALAAAAADDDDDDDSVADAIAALAAVAADANAAIAAANAVIAADIAAALAEDDNDNDNEEEEEDHQEEDEDEEDEGMYDGETDTRSCQSTSADSSADATTTTTTTAPVMRH
jgi:hypothetical protein